jgi:alkylation response protein AidB-like acyl-CoA dehydrogenase
MIPYGLNKIDIKVPQQNKLIPESTGLKMMLDILHRSRLQFPGMGMGFLKRMMEDASKHCQERQVGAGNLFHRSGTVSAFQNAVFLYTLFGDVCEKC